MNKNLNNTLFSLLALVILLSSCKTRTSIEGTQNIVQLKALFADPPSEFRSAPLWDWNEQISEEGIDFQMKEFKKAGIGGVFVHPRPGLLTEYLSDEWFRLFDYAVQKGKELDMKVWIYDENSYPSGFAGGHVPAEMPDAYRHGAGLKLDIIDKLEIALTDTIEVILKKTGDTFTDITSETKSEAGKTGTYYVFSKTYPSKSYWYGGFSYVDLLYPGVTEKFLDLTMKQGYEKNLADFGQTVPGIFTDEPNLEAAMPPGTLLRWTPDLWEAFEQRWGYDLKPNLVSLIEETGNWKKVRHDYYELLLELFIDRWAKPCSEYCEAHHLKWTGHYWEHGWPEPTHGFDEAAFYLFHQMPWVDMLGNRLDPRGLGGQFGNDRAVRELRSAANQAGRNRTLSETYGGGGWEMSFETQKRLVDWEVVLGVNFVNQHLSYYSLNGVRKFDYPPSFSYHEPWWEHYKLMGDYIGRISMAISAGEQINRTLVLQPNTTAWMYFSRTGKNSAIDSIKNGFKNFVYRLEQKHVEYDLGSEYVLRTIGSAENGKLQVGKRKYDLVVIPAEMENIDLSTLNLLTEYLEQGGKVLSFIPEIKYVDGQESQPASALSKNFPGQWIHEKSLEQTKVENLLASGDFSIQDLTGNGMTYHQRRMLSDGQLVFIVNSHPEKKARVKVSGRGKSVSKMDLVSGEIFSYPAEKENGAITFKVELEPAGSALFAIGKKKSVEKDLIQATGTETVIQPTGAPAIQRESDNVLVVNYLDIRTAKSEKKEVYFMNALIDLFTENGIEMGNPWQHKIQYKKNYLELDTLFGDDSWFEADYHFTINTNLEPKAMENIRVVAERPELWTVSVNGNKVEEISGTYWIDREFPQYEAGRFLKPGENTVTIRAPRMNILAELMPVYILGDFSVVPSQKGFEITAAQNLTTGSWRENGMPFYAQTVRYSQTFSVEKDKFKTFKVRLPAFNAPVCEVLVNGVPAGLITWKPYELDVAKFLNDGENEIAVRVYGSLKNTFGFFYQKNDNWIFGPFSWNYAPEKIPDASEYYLMDYGIFEPFRLVGIN